jgi:hypothetical protein
MRKRTFLAVLALLAPAGPSLAFPPSFCHESLTGLLRTTESVSFSPGFIVVVGKVDVRLTVRNDEGDLSLGGLFQCRRPSGSRTSCAGSGLTGSLDGVPNLPTEDHFGSSFIIHLLQPGPGYHVLCQLDGTAPVVWHGCIPAISGTYVCKQGEVETEHGTFELVASSCGQCFSHPAG